MGGGNQQHCCRGTMPRNQGWRHDLILNFSLFVLSSLGQTSSAASLLITASQPHLLGYLLRHADQVVSQRVGVGGS